MPIFKANKASPIKNNSLVWCILLLNPLTKDPKAAWVREEHIFYMNTA